MEYFSADFPSMSTGSGTCLHESTMHFFFGCTLHPTQPTFEVVVVNAICASVIASCSGYNIHALQPYKSECSEFTFFFMSTLGVGWMPPSTLPTPALVGRPAEVLPRSGGQRAPADRQFPPMDYAPLLHTLSAAYLSIMVFPSHQRLHTSWCAF